MLVSANKCDPNSRLNCFRGERSPDIGSKVALLKVAEAKLGSFDLDLQETGKIYCFFGNFT